MDVDSSPSAPSLAAGAGGVRPEALGARLQIVYEHDEAAMSSSDGGSLSSGSARSGSPVACAALEGGLA